MLNSLDEYRESGKRAAHAMNQHDISRYKFEDEWYRSAKNMENEEDRLVISQAYEEAFRTERITSQPESFK